MVSRLQKRANKLLKKVVERLDLEKDNYIVKVTGRIRARNANAQVWIWLDNKRERIIKISKNYIKKASSRRIVKTLIHEISHFKQMEQMIEAVGENEDDIDEYRKSRPTTYRWTSPLWHNVDFDIIYANLLYEYKCRTKKEKYLNSRNE